MTASDDARQAIARAAVADADNWQGRKFGIDDVLAAVMPDGRSIAQWIDDGAVALRLVRLFSDELVSWSDEDDEGQRIYERVNDNGAWVPLADVDPAVADLLARLEADQ